MASARRPASLDIIAKIEAIFENITDSLLREDELIIPLRCKKSQSTALDELETEPCTKLTKVSFPAKTPQEEWRFSTQKSASRGLAVANMISSCTAPYPRAHTPSVVQQCHRLQEVHLSFCSSIPTSTDPWLCRNIYYKNPALFKSQHVVNRYVDILAYTFGVQRADLNVVSLLPIRRECQLIAVVSRLLLQRVSWLGNSL